MPDHPVVLVCCPHRGCNALLRAAPPLLGRRTVCPQCDGPLRVTTAWYDEPLTDEIVLPPTPVDTPPSG